MPKSLSRAKGATFFVVGLSDDGISSTVQEFTGSDFHGAVMHTRDFGITPMGIVATREQADALALNVREVAWDSDENKEWRETVEKMNATSQDAFHGTPIRY